MKFNVYLKSNEKFFILLATTFNKSEKEQLGESCESIVLVCIYLCVWSCGRRFACD